MKKETIRNILLLIFFLIVLLFLLFNEYGLIKYYKLKQEISSLKNQIDDKNKKIDDLQLEIDSLRNNDFKLEKVAREKYNMSKPNEKVIRFK